MCSISSNTWWASMKLAANQRHRTMNFPHTHAFDEDLQSNREHTQVQQKSWWKFFSNTSVRCLLCADQSCSGCQAKGCHSLHACTQEGLAPALLPQHRLATVPCQTLLSTATREAPPFPLRITRTKKHTRKTKAGTHANFKF